MNRNLIFKVIAGLTGLGLLAGGMFALYFVGNRTLPTMILSAYQEKNCQKVASFSEMFNRFYPEDAGITSHVRECNDYSAAITYKENGEWQNAYLAFKNYPNSYPTGVFTSESYEEAAYSLVRLANEQYQNRQYDEAVKNLQTAIAVYGFTTSSKEAGNLLVSVYTDWASELRAAENFEEAEKKLLAFRAGAEAAGQSEKISTAGLLLAQTYLDWGQFLQDKGEFELASKRLQKAIQVSSDEEIVAQAQNQFLAIYTAWANSLFEQENFEPAIGKFKEGLLFVGEQNQPSINKSIGEVYIRWAQSLLEQNNYEAAIDKFTDGLAIIGKDGQETIHSSIGDTYVHWAQSLMQLEDYTGAIEKLKKTENISDINNTTTKAIQDAQREVYRLFSQSSGKQAQQAMEDAIKKLCERGQASQLPIFGTNEGSQAFALYGMNNALPDALIARTPADLRYVVCAKENEKQIEAKTVTLYQTHGKTGPQLTFGTVTLTRTQYIWDIKLMDMKTGDVIATKTIEGPTPIKYPYRIYCFGKDCLVRVKDKDSIPQSVQGERPNINLLIDWLLSVIK